MHQVIAIVGHTGSGKTTTARLLSQRLSIPMITFSEVGNEFAHLHGFERLRDCLYYCLFENGGDSVFLSKFLEYMISNTLKVKGDSPIIIEGIFCYEAIVALRQHYSDIIIFNINVPLITRIMRISERLCIPFEQALDENQIKENNKIALGMDRIISQSDYNLDGLKSQTSIVDAIVNALFE